MLSRMSHVRPLPLIPFRSLLTLSSQQRLSLPSGHVPSGFQTKILYAFSFSSIHAALQWPDASQKYFSINSFLLWNLVHFLSYGYTITKHDKKTENNLKCISKQSKARVSWTCRKWCVAAEWTNWWVEMQTMSAISMIKSDARKYYVLIQKALTLNFWRRNYFFNFSTPCI